MELPVSATEDRVVGTLDLERALKEGVRAFEPGLLAQANGNILYVDEINLLEDHIVDVLLDSAAMGVNTVEREGISYSHPARFILVGTMNPEEGDLRPQLLDRFGLMVEVHGEQEAEARKEVVRRRLAFEENPAAFCARWAPEQEALRRRIGSAQALLPQVSLPEPLFDTVARVCTALQVDGHRADITMLKTARALAALEGRTEAGMEELRRAVHSGAGPGRPGRSAPAGAAGKRHGGHAAGRCGAGGGGAHRPQNLPARFAGPGRRGGTLCRRGKFAPLRPDRRPAGHAGDRSVPDGAGRHLPHLPRPLRPGGHHESGGGDAPPPVAGPLWPLCGGNGGAGAGGPERGGAPPLGL